MNYSGKKAIVIGMAKSGLAAARLLKELGAEVIVYDAKKIEDLSPEIVKEIKDNEYDSIFAADPVEAIKECDIVVMSPGVPPTLPFIILARKLKKYIISEMELGFQFTKGKVAAITGTNGKTTTVSLLGEIMKNAAKTTHVVGNIGTPIAKEALKTSNKDVTIAEVSSYQLDETDTFKPEISAILNITPDHLNRYKTMDNYIASKAQIFKNQDAKDCIVLNWDDKTLREISKSAKGKIYWFSRKDNLKRGAYLRDNDIVFKDDDGIEKYICNKMQVYIPGDHNLENALCAVTVASILGVSAQVIRKTLMTFTGVEHRIEFVREVRGVRYINDSKGTNPDATIKACEAMRAPTVLILGGYDKGGDFFELFNTFNGYIKAVIAIGETKYKIKDAADQCGFNNIVLAETFEQAVEISTDYATPGMNVLLSPACASFDMFNDYEHRGKVFKELVNSIEEK